MTADKMVWNLCTFLSPIKTFWKLILFLLNSFMMEAPYHIETSPLICSANQWTGFYMIGPSVMKELKAAQYFPTKSAIIDFDRAFDMPIVAATLLPPH